MFYLGILKLSKTDESLAEFEIYFFPIKFLRNYYDQYTSRDPSIQIMSRN